MWKGERTRRHDAPLSFFVLLLAASLVACSSAGGSSGSATGASPASSRSASVQGSDCPNASASDLLLPASEAPAGFKMQTPTRLSPSPPQTFDSGASVSYLKRGNAGFFAVSSAVFLYPSAAVASAALAGNKESLAAFGLLTPVSAPTIGEESYAVFQSVRGSTLSVGVDATTSSRSMCRALRRSVQPWYWPGWLMRRLSASDTSAFGNGLRVVGASSGGISAFSHCACPVQPCVDTPVRSRRGRCVRRPRWLKGSAKAKLGLDPRIERGISCSRSVRSTRRSPPCVVLRP